MISQNTLQLILAFGRVGFLLYNVTALSFRIAFQSHFIYSVENIGLVVLDYVSDIFFLADFVGMLLYSTRNEVIVPVDTPKLEESSVTGRAIQMMRRKSESAIANLHMKKEQRHHISHHMLKIFYLIPFEFIGYLVGYQYYYLLRLTKVLRVLESRKYSNDCVKAIENMGITVSPAWARVVMFCIIQCILCHVAGCMYFKMGVHSMHSGDGRSNWLLHDNNAKVDDDGNVVFLHGTAYLYVRSLYFAVQTVVSNDKVLSQYAWCLVLSAS
jgi:hypothetical protein